MPAPRLHETLIAERIVELIDQGLAAEMGLKVVAIGALEFFPALESLADNVPAVFVKPSPATNLERITTGQTYRIVYNFRIVLVKAFGPNEEIIKHKTEEAQKIAELLIDNVDLGGLALPNGQVLFSTLKTIEWEPPEDNLVATINATMTAAALVFAVETTSRK
ncbi:MAG TPA: hypothetical protein DCM05_17750 [Elusimicrobia bacterium]|nr:hypothetical protein [Elusimicrobiota bacterium]